MILTADKNLWYIIKNGDNIHFGELYKDSTMENVKPIMIYYNKLQWENELKKLNKDPKDGFLIDNSISNEPIEPIDFTENMIKPITPLSIFDIMEKSKLKR
jgi:hypothetical protein